MFVRTLATVTNVGIDLELRRNDNVLKVMCAANMKKLSCAPVSQE